MLLSAITTIIGFISLTFTPMAPIATVGWALSGGILVVYVLTIFMTPNLLILLDLKKAKHPPLQSVQRGGLRPHQSTSGGACLLPGRDVGQRGRGLTPGG